ncbi:MAG: PDZ domain-containing protein [Synechococcaceae cyanobacterium RL_1_2]|nr:PDZ domain-containing protein [Synechococcaceae cyanobacterium RL_1_2]
MKNPFRYSLVRYLVVLGCGMALAMGLYKSSPSFIANALEVEPTDLVAQVQPEASPRNFVANAVDRVGQAVVRIDTEKTVTRQADPFFDDPMFRQFFGDSFGFNLPPQEQVMRGQGSGFIIDNQGTVLTNAHVVNGADKVTISIKDGRSLEGKVMGVDEVTDLAVVKVKGENLPIAALGDSAQLKVGDWAIAVGNPVGLDNTVTLGIVSTLNRSSAQAGIPDKRLDFIQTDAAINPGNSGGPLLNDQGEVIGINTAIRTDAMGIGFAIPINKVKTVYPQLARGEKVQHPYLGVRMVGLTPEMAQKNNNDPNSIISLPQVNGILVVQVMADSPAAIGGIKKGDVIVKFDGQSVTDPADLQRMVENSRVNQRVEVEIIRNGKNQKLTLTTSTIDNLS